MKKIFDKNFSRRRFTTEQKYFWSQMRNCKRGFLIVCLRKKMLRHGGKMKKVKITVLRKQLYEDLAEKYLTDGKDVECDYYQEGDTFIYTSGAEMPEGFCPWAWISIYSKVSALSLGATYTPWQKKDGINIGCCPDGIRPVTFLMEALAESDSR